MPKLIAALSLLSVMLWSPERALAADPMEALAIQGLHASTQSEIPGTVRDLAAQTLLIAGTTLAVKIEIEAERAPGEEGRPYLSAIKVRVSLNDEIDTALTAGSVGVGESTTAARVSAVRGWVEGYGVAIARMLSRTGGLEGVFEDAVVYLGRTSFRPKAPAGWHNASSMFHATSLNAVWPTLAEYRAAADPVAVDLQLLMNARGATSGELRVNGVKTPSVPALTFSEPFPSDRFIVKQYYLIVPDVPAANETPAP